MTLSVKLVNAGSYVHFAEGTANMSSSDLGSEELQHSVTEGCVEDDLSAAEEASIDCIPDEILEYILSLTSPYCDFKSALQVSRRWYSIARSMLSTFTVYWLEFN